MIKRNNNGDKNNENARSSSALPYLVVCTKKSCFKFMCTFSREKHVGPSFGNTKTNEFYDLGLQTLLLKTDEFFSSSWKKEHDRRKKRKMDETNGIEAAPEASAPAPAPEASPTTVNVDDVKRKTKNKKKRKTKNDDDFLRLHESPEDDYGAVQLKKKVEVKENNFDDDDGEDDTTVIASDSELDDALNKEEEEMKKEDDDDNKTEEDSEIQSTKTKTISTRELIVKRKENVEALMRVYEQTYYDLIETMRKRHRKFQLKHGHVGLKSAATALANARGLKAGKDDGENTIVDGEQQQQQHEGGDHEREQNGTRTTCSSETCEKNAMPFSRFCFEHVSLDAKQRFYEVIDGKLEWRVNEKFMMNAQKPSSTSEDDDGCGANETPGKGNDAKEENDDAVPEPATDPKPLKEMSPGPPGGGVNPNASTSPGGADMSLAASLGLL